MLAFSLFGWSLCPLTQIAIASYEIEASMSAISGQVSKFDLADYRPLDNETLTRRINVVRGEFGSRLLILGHHYQQDDVIALSDLRGDSYQLSKVAASNSQCRTIVFCGVHFMAETADILANRPEKLAERGAQRVARDPA